MIFNYFKKRKELKVKRIQFLRVEKRKILDKCEEIASKQNSSSYKRKSDKNDICPNCKSKNIVDAIKRVQGDIKGSISGGGFLSPINGRIGGNIDTNEIRKCQDCGNEWKKYECDYKLKREVLHDKLNLIGWQLEDYDDLKNCTYNENDLNEKYNSLEEKKDALREKLNLTYRVKEIEEFWTGVTFDMLDEFVKLEENRYCARKIIDNYDKDFILKMGFKELELDKI